MRQNSSYLTYLFVLCFSLLPGCGGNPNSPGSSSRASSSSSSGEAKSHAFYIGSTAPSNKFRSDFADNWQQIATQFNGTWEGIESARDTYKWDSVDAFYQYAKGHNLRFHHSALIWGAQNPAWINNLSATETSQEIEEWISQFCKRYSDADLITVVNEPSPGHQPAL